MSLTLALCLSVAGCEREKSGKLQVFCAASLASVVEQTAAAEGIAIELNSGGSNALVRQVNLGAQTDLLLLADDKLAQATLAPKGYRIQALASNALVVIAPKSAAVPTQPDLPKALNPDGQAKLAVADAKTAPLGVYTEEALKGISLRSQVVPMQDASAVLMAVALGHAQRGIVYLTDARSEPKVDMICTISAARHPTVRYVSAMPPKAPAGSQQLVESLLHGKGQAILGQSGFLPAPAEASVQ